MNLQKIYLNEKGGGIDQNFALKSLSILKNGVPEMEQKRRLEDVA